MHCPVCGQEMRSDKAQACFGRKTNTEYKRTYYRCEKDDVWGRLEVPVGPISELDQKRISTIATH
jgi:hypothetical protein